MHGLDFDSLIFKKNTKKRNQRRKENKEQMWIEMAVSHALLVNSFDYHYFALHFSESPSVKTARLGPPFRL